MITYQWSQSNNIVSTQPDFTIKYFLQAIFQLPINMQTYTIHTGLFFAFIVVCHNINFTWSKTYNFIPASLPVWNQWIKQGFQLFKKKNLLNHNLIAIFPNNKYKLPPSLMKINCFSALTIMLWLIKFKGPARFICCNSIVTH